MATHPKTTKSTSTIVDNDELVNMTETKQKAGQAIKAGSRALEAAAARKRQAQATAKDREAERAAAEKAEIAMAQDRLRAEFYARRGQAPPLKPHES